MPHPLIFTLPEMASSFADESFFDVDESRLLILGEYVPGGNAVVYDPLSTGSIPAEAVAVHELRHQFLMLNTTFGRFTGILERLVLEGWAQRAHLECRKRQWPVQELAATYAGLSFVAMNQPAGLMDAIERLPSARRSLPPYRELFDSIQGWIPLEPDLPREVTVSRDILVGLLAMFAMNSDCLSRLRDASVEDDALISCLTDLPVRRFERLLSHLLREDAVDRFCAEIAEVHSDGPAVAVVSERLRRLLTRSGVDVQSEAQLEEQLVTIVEEWLPAARERAAAGPRRDVPPRPPAARLSAVRRLRRDPYVEIRDSPEREERGRRGIRQLSVAAIRQHLDEISDRGLGLSLELAVRAAEREIIHVVLRPYHLDPTDPPRPGREGTPPSLPLPADLSGLVEPSALLDELARFPDLPHILVFIDGSRRRWAEIPGGDALLAGAVLVCRQTGLAFDETRDNILSFENLGADPQFFLLRLASERYVGCFFSESVPGAYGLQKVPGEYGLRLFRAICADLEVAESADGGSAAADVPLLNLVAFDYAWH